MSKALGTAEFRFEPIYPTRLEPLNDEWAPVELSTSGEFDEYLLLEYEGSTTILDPVEVQDLIRQARHWLTSRRVIKDE